MASRELPHVALSARAHNREALHRTDEAWLEREWGSPETRVLVLAGARVRAAEDGLAWVAPDEAPDGVRVLLGRRDGVTRFAVLGEPRRDEDGWLGARELVAGLAAGDRGPGEVPWLFHAVGLAEWHRSTRFCPRCGGSLEVRSAGHELRCTACGRAQFPRTDPAVIMAVSHGEPGSDQERLLLGRQASWPQGRWSTLAGFCEPGETLEDAVRREVAEEVGVEVGEVSYVGSQPWPLPASLMVGFLARALTTKIDVDGAEIEDARWFTREELREGMASGEVRVPGSVSISSSLLELWYGEPLPSGW
ncbi:NAD(+) diphosphatase [Nocardioides campestrisoli]|uniref:NAD(+) diphosphatase n=1 Tax=Nocardioides campestrisoli TaxID=2736757 RepID=UPI0015E66223|nr:NAD(+) diphosphatase [Nocardioides campestrisoli]